MAPNAAAVSSMQLSTIPRFRHPSSDPGQPRRSRAPWPPRLHLQRRTPTPVAPWSDFGEARTQRRLHAPRPATGPRAWPSCERPSMTPAPTLGSRTPACYRPRPRVRDDAPAAPRRTPPMSRIGLLDDGVVYPTSDGQPMAETARSIADCMVDVADPRSSWWFRKGSGVTTSTSARTTSCTTSGATPVRWWPRTSTWWWERRHPPLATRTSCGTSRRGRTSCWR